VREYKTDITTTFGEKDAVACDVHVLDGPKANEVYDNALLFQGALVGSLKFAAGGDPVLGRIGVGVAKPNQNAPWILIPFTDADAVLATAYVARMPKPFQAPAAAPAVPTPAAAPPVAAVPSPAAASPAAASPAAPAPAVNWAALPAEVQELLRQSGQMPAA